MFEFELLFTGGISKALLEESFNSRFLAALEASSDNRTIKSIFDEYCKDMKVDSRFIKMVKAFDQGFITKNTDHINFFGSGLLGVYPIKWLDDERNAWVEDILMADDIGLENDLHRLPTIDPTRKVTSDIINLSFVYVAHRIMNSSLTEKEKHDGLISTFRINHYKYLSSLLSHYFRYPADEAVAKATYMALSQKFGIKQAGNWFNLLTRRAEDIISKNSIHRDRIKYMRDDAGVLYLVSDIQTRIRAAVKAQTAVFHDVRQADGRVISTSKLAQLDEGLMVRDVKREHSKYTRFFEDTVLIPSDFIRTDLVELILNVMPSASPDVVRVSLDFLVNNYSNKNKKYLKKLSEEVLLYTFDFLFRNRIRTTNFREIVPRLKSMFTGSRINDKVILELRELGDKLVREASGKKNNVQVAAERTAVLLYIILRTLAYDHYK